MVLTEFELSDMSTHKNLRDAAQSGNLEEVQRLFSSSNDMDKINALCASASNGYHQCLEYILSEVALEPFYRLYKGAVVFAAMDHINCIALLMPSWDNDTCHGYVSAAASGGHLECTNFFIQQGFPQTHYNAALWAAAKKGEAECVKALLAVANPKDAYSRALREAAAECHIECMEILYDHSDPQVALEVLRYRLSHKTESHALLNDLIARKQHDNLLAATEGLGCLSPTRKM